MKAKISFLLLVLALLFSCQQTQSGETNKIKKGMIKVAILYPNGEGKTFDMDYYPIKHMPLASFTVETPRFYHSARIVF